MTWTAFQLLADCLSACSAIIESNDLYVIHELAKDIDRDIDKAMDIINQMSAKSL